MVKISSWAIITAWVAWNSDQIGMGAGCLWPHIFRKTRALTVLPSAKQANLRLWQPLPLLSLRLLACPSMNFWIWDTPRNLWGEGIQPSERWKSLTEQSDLFELIFPLPGPINLFLFPSFSSPQLFINPLPSVYNPVPFSLFEFFFVRSPQRGRSPPSSPRLISCCLTMTYSET